MKRAGIYRYMVESCGGVEHGDGANDHLSSVRIWGFLLLAYVRSH